MSTFSEQEEPAENCIENPCDAISLVITPRERDLGGFSVRRVLPFAKRRNVGPFVFFDHLGPAQFAAGDGVNVRAHPHIGLATVTYLFEGEVLHKDSLGYEQRITPGAVNLMVAGKGIVHAELTPEELRGKEHNIHALQLWVALPDAEEECDPSFHHYDADSIPHTTQDGTAIRVLMGSAYGLTSPVKTLSPTLYVEAVLEEGAALTLPEAAERALYIISGELTAKDTTLAPQEMVVFDNTATISVTATKPTTLVIIGGDSVGKRHMFWNFVSSSKERIQQAQDDWQAQRMGQVPGEEDFIPLP